MFDFLFGWRKASKCKKLIKTVRCRLRLLRSKRSCIVKMGREDIALLLKHGHHQIALKRVEYLVMDENMVQIYDLLDQYCEFIIINLRYIRKRRDCPDEINEAVSTLVYSSARFGDLPELISIRKLFGERYGQRFVVTALELHSGNLVNHQIIKNLHMKRVPDEVMHRLLHEIAGACVRTGPLLLEYKPKLQQAETRKEINEVELQFSLWTGETGGTVICLDSLSDWNKVSKEACVVQRNNADCNEKAKFAYFDDHIEEFVSNVSRDGILQDQRLFTFRSVGIPLKTSKINDEQVHLQVSSKSCHSKITKDAYCAESFHSGREQRNKLSGYNAKKCSLEQPCYHCCDRNKLSEYNAKKCSLEQPCYLCCADENDLLPLHGMTVSGDGVEGEYSDNIVRSKPFLSEQCKNGNSFLRHIHPKLPDYDELAAKFKELKREYIRNQQKNA